MQCLVTGGAGFIGSHLVRELLRQGRAVRVLDDFSTGSERNLDGFDVEICKGDVRSDADVRAAVAGAEWVFHLAALASVTRSLEAPLSTHAVDATGTLTVLNACREAGVSRVIYAGSSSAYGNVKQLPKRESMKPMPASPYAVAKLCGEYYCQAFWQAFGLETVCVRYFNVFGPRQNPHSQYAAVIPRFIEAALRGEPPVIYGDGGQTRDFTYVANAVDGTVRAAWAPRVAGKVINVACNERRSLLDVVAVLEQLLGRPIQPIFEKTRAGDVHDSQADIARARRLLGYAPRTDFKTGLQATLDWYRNAYRGASPEPVARLPEAARQQATAAGGLASG